VRHARARPRGARERGRGVSVADGDRGDAHRSAVAQRALAPERRARRLVRVDPGAHEPQHFAGTRPVPTPRVVGVGEGVRERLCVDAAVLEQRLG
jgi:hypothetical protein